MPFAGETDGSELALVGRSYFVAAETGNLANSLTELLSFLDQRVGYTAFEVGLTLFFLHIHLALELLAALVRQPNFLEQAVSREIFEVLGDTSDWLQQFFLVVLIVEFKWALLIMEFWVKVKLLCDCW